MLIRYKIFDKDFELINGKLYIKNKYLKVKLNYLVSKREFSYDELMGMFVDSYLKTIRTYKIETMEWEEFINTDCNMELNKFYKYLNIRIDKAYVDKLHERYTHLKRTKSINNIQEFISTEEPLYNTFELINEINIENVLETIDLDEMQGKLTQYNKYKIWVNLYYKYILIKSQMEFYEHIISIGETPIKRRYKDENGNIYRLPKPSYTDYIMVSKDTINESSYHQKINRLINTIQLKYDEYIELSKSTLIEEYNNLSNELEVKLVWIYNNRIHLKYLYNSFNKYEEFINIMKHVIDGITVKTLLNNGKSIDELLNDKDIEVIFNMEEHIYNHIKLMEMLV